VTATDAAAAGYLAGADGELDPWAELGDALVALGALRRQLAEVTRQRDVARAAYLHASVAADAYSADRADWYRAGFLTGQAVERGIAVRLEQEARRAESADVGGHTAGPTYAELDRRRYPATRPGGPAGRVYWLTRTLGALWDSWSDWCALADLDGDGADRGE
jgi:hypothetical protein